VLHVAPIAGQELTMWLAVTLAQCVQVPQGVAVRHLARLVRREALM